jgi:hypothetical protein
VDYERTMPPNINDYGGDMYTLITECPDPILAAIAVTGEREKPAWGHWVRVLNQARRERGRPIADQLFRECLHRTWAEDKAGECDKPGAILNLKLRDAFS